MIELEVTPVTITFFVLLISFVLYLYSDSFRTPQEGLDAPFNEREGYHTLENLNPNYGAYIQLYGKRY